MVLPAVIRGVIYSGFAKGLNAVAISNLLRTKHSFQITARAIRRYKDRYGVFVRRKVRTGKLQKVHKDYINFLMNDSSSMTAASIQKKLMEVFRLKVSLATVKRARSSLGWVCKKTSYCQLITKVNAKKRYVYAVEQLTRRETFMDVIFTDESTVELNANGTLMFYRPGQAMDKLPAKFCKPKHSYKVIFSYINVVFSKKLYNINIQLGRQF